MHRCMHAYHIQIYTHVHAHVPHTYKDTWIQRHTFKESRAETLIRTFLESPLALSILKPCLRTKSAVEIYVTYSAVPSFFGRNLSVPSMQYECVLKKKCMCVCVHSYIACAHICMYLHMNLSAFAYHRRKQTHSCLHYKHPHTRGNCRSWAHARISW
jgi:hypothetical protein